MPNVEGFPTHASLDKVSPNNPVLLVHASGHASFVNGKAMELSGIRRPTESPAGGEMLRDANGDATGLMRETAQGLIKRGAGAPPPTPAETAARDREVLELASKEVLSKGITTFEDAGSPLSTIDLMKKMVDEGKIGVRLWVMVRQPNATIAPRLAQYKMIDYGDGHLTVRAIKKQIDGALGSRGAWLLAPYADKPGSSGLETTPVAEIDETAPHRDAERLPVVRARDRRPRQPRDARHLRARLQGQSREEGSALARRARAAHQRAGHPALREDRGDRVDAGHPLHVRRALRPRAPRRRARARGGLRLAEADEDRRR